MLYQKFELLRFSLYFFSNFDDTFSLYMIVFRQFLNFTYHAQSNNNLLFGNMFYFDSLFILKIDKEDYVVDPPMKNVNGCDSILCVYLKTNEYMFFYNLLIFFVILSFTCTVILFFILSAYNYVIVVTLSTQFG